MSVRDDAAGINYTNITLFDCVRLAYGVRRFQLSGPNWIYRQKYMLQAKAADPVSAEQRMAMLRTLLAERFKLVVHREQRVTDAFDLMVDKTGPKLKVSADDSRFGIREHADGPQSDSRMEFTHNSMTDLADDLTRSSTVLNRPVIDKTGLEGFYDFSFSYAKVSDPASIFDALKTSLGLRLEPHKEPLEFLVIDGAEQIPTEN